MMWLRKSPGSGLKLKVCPCKLKVCPCMKNLILIIGFSLSLAFTSYGQVRFYRMMRVYMPSNGDENKKEIIEKLKYPKYLQNIINKAINPYYVVEGNASIGGKNAPYVIVLSSENDTLFWEVGMEFSGQFEFKGSGKVPFVSVIDSNGNYFYIYMEGSNLPKVVLEKDSTIIIDIQFEPNLNDLSKQEVEIKSITYQLPNGTTFTVKYTENSEKFYLIYKGKEYGPYDSKKYEIVISPKGTILGVKDTSNGTIILLSSTKTFSPNGYGMMNRRSYGGKYNGGKYNGGKYNTKPHYGYPGYGR